MHTVRVIAFFSFFVTLIFFSCSRPQPVVDIYVHHWSEGSSVSLNRSGKVVARSSLFGDHVWVTTTKRGVYTIRVASPGILVAVIDGLKIGTGVTTHTPSPCRSCVGGAAARRQLPGARVRWNHLRMG